MLIEREGISSERAPEGVKKIFPEATEILVLKNYTKKSSGTSNIRMISLIFWGTLKPI